MLFIVVLVSFISMMSGFLMLWKVPLAIKDTNNSSVKKTVSIIIPARNEEDRLPTLLASLNNQSYKPIEVIVVDDESSDRTVAVAQQQGAKVIKKRKNDEWMGKSAACWSGANEAKGDWLLFLDADTFFEDKTSLEQLLATYQSGDAIGILSFQPFHKITNGYENLSAVFNIILMAGMNVFTPLGTQIETAGSFGPCILCDKEEYFIVGGHKAIKGAIMDDLALGEKFRENNFPVRCYGGRGIIQFQMYPEGIKQLVEGWTKSFGTAAQSTHPLVTSLISLWISGAFFTIGSLIVALLANNTSLLIVASLVCTVFAVQFYWLAHRFGQFSLWILFGYPLFFLFFIGLFVWSLFLTKVLHRVTWSGRKLEV
ncbi:glycosyltransferase family 2 protein [Carnobacterium sp.]|uniref:glycosyltransferase family 2 protein n=1 Tax=Carnobacterium sp. TaxID=48221 RepID=UPI00388FD863